MNGSGATSMNEQESNKAIKQENHASHKTSLMARRDEVPTEHKRESNKAIINALKEKTTFNLSTEILQALEESWIHLRRKLKGEQRITKTLIVEKAIEIALADFESKSELSDLYIQLKRK